MSKLEIILLELLKVGEFVAPMFIHSSGAVAALNMSEDFVNTAVQVAVAKQSGTAPSTVTVQTTGNTGPVSISTTPK